MGRKPCCRKEEGLNKGAWSVQEDMILNQYINAHGKGKWRDLPGRAGLKRCGKSCRLRWLNYLNPNIKRGNISPDEDGLIIRLHNLLGNRWSLIAGRLPGRTDNEITNYWNTNLSKKINALPKQQMSNSAKDHGSTGTAAMDRPHQVIRPKGVRCNKSYPIVPFHQLHDAEAKQQPALPIATSTSAAMPLVLLEETDLSKYFVDFFDQDQLHAGGADEDLLLQAWHFDMKDNASDMYEGDGTCNAFTSIQEIVRFESMVRTNLKRVLNGEEGSHL